ncbi:hypothetical protein NZK33_15440 [Cyanobium sp. FGCU-6]|nr:hypothetical protein [Cyanobium sp. FGCU6]
MSGSLLLTAWMEEAQGLGATADDPPRQEPFGDVAWLLGDPEGNRLLPLALP